MIKTQSQARLVATAIALVALVLSACTKPSPTSAPPAVPKPTAEGPQGPAPKEPSPTTPVTISPLGEPQLEIAPAKAKKLTLICSPEPRQNKRNIETLRLGEINATVSMMTGLTETVLFSEKAANARSFSLDCLGALNMQSGLAAKASQNYVITYFPLGSGSRQTEIIYDLESPVGPIEVVFGNGARIFFNSKTGALLDDPRGCLKLKEPDIQRPARNNQLPRYFVQPQYSCGGALLELEATDFPNPGAFAAVSSADCGQLIISANKLARKYTAEEIASDREHRINKYDAFYTFTQVDEAVLGILEELIQTANPGLVTKARCLKDVILKVH